MDVHFTYIVYFSMILYHEIEKKLCKNYSYDDDLRFPYNVKSFKMYFFLFCNVGNFLILVPKDFFLFDYMC